MTEAPGLAPGSLSPDIVRPEPSKEEALKALEHLRTEYERDMERLRLRIEKIDRFSREGNMGLPAAARHWYAQRMSTRKIREEIQQLTDKIAREFRPEKVILFGSWAWGKPGPDSDVDLCVVKETPDTREFARRIDRALYPRQLPIDILVYTPQGIERRLRVGDVFLRDILRKGKILYERR